MTTDFRGNGNSKNRLICDCAGCPHLIHSCSYTLLVAIEGCYLRLRKGDLRQRCSIRQSVVRDANSEISQSTLNAATRAEKKRTQKARLLVPSLLGNPIGDAKSITWSFSLLQEHVRKVRRKFTRVLVLHFFAWRSWRALSPAISLL